MSFMSMLQMAKGKEPEHSDPNHQRKRASSGDQSKAAAKDKSSPQAKPKPPSYNLYTPSSRPIVKDQAKSTTNLQRQVKPVPDQPVLAARHIPSERRELSSSKPSAPVPARSKLPTSNHAPSTSLSMKQSPKSQAASTLNLPKSAAGVPVKKKLSFKDMMKRASEIDKSKLAVNLRVASNSRNEKTPRDIKAQRSGQLGSGDTGVSNSANSNGLGGGQSPSQSGALKERMDHETQRKKAFAKTAAPVARPFPELAEKLERRQILREKASKRGYEESDEDLDDFVVSEEEDNGLRERPRAGDGREDIWSLFNRKPRSQYMESESDDDMEAKGADIIDEERQSAAFGRREDIEEERRLEELARKKKMRKLS